MEESAHPGEDPHERPVLYLDLDDTVVSWASGDPGRAEGACEFLHWALEMFEVRWLTSWAPSGRMKPELVRDLSKLTGVARERLEEIRGLDWEGATKIDGIAWLEHLVRGRPFVWIEDASIQDSSIQFLREHGWYDCFVSCDVTRDSGAIRRVHQTLRTRFG